MTRRIVLVSLLFLSLSVSAATNSFVFSFFEVANINTNAGTANLVGSVAVENTNNTPFFILSNAILSVVSGQTQKVYVGFYTSGWSYGAYSNRMIFTSNGGNSTNSVTGKIVPKAPATLIIK